MISVTAAICLIFIHWIADFLLQSDAMAKSKSKYFDWLLWHTVVYSLCFFVLLMPFCGVLFAAKFAAVTLFFHTLTDFFTSRLNSKLWTEGRIHYFFVSVGYDQWLHGAQILLTFYFLS